MSVPPSVWIALIVALLVGWLVLALATIHFRWPAVATIVIFVSVIPLLLLVVPFLLATRRESQRAM